MSAQLYIPKETPAEAETRRADREEANRAWRLGQLLQSATGGDTDGRVINWAAMPHLRVWR
jgi:hypothetical protein